MGGGGKEEEEGVIIRLILEEMEEVCGVGKKDRGIEAVVKGDMEMVFFIIISIIFTILII